MLALHLLAGAILAFSGAFWGWGEGYSLWAMLGLYILGGSMGVVGSALTALVLPRTPMRSETSGLSQGI